MECISALYEQEIMAQHINYAILEDAYITEASNDKKPFKERVLEIINKVLTFIKKFFTETLPKVLRSLSNKISRLTNETIKCTDPALIEKQYKLGAQTVDEYCKAVEKYHDGLMKKINSNDEKESLKEYENPLDAKEFMKNAGMQTIDELDSAPQGKHTAKEFQRAIENINSMSKNLTEKNATKTLEEIKKSAIKTATQDSTFSEKYLSNVVKSASSISAIIIRINQYLKFALNIYNKFVGTLGVYMEPTGNNE